MYGNTNGEAVNHAAVSESMAASDSGCKLRSWLALST